MKLKHWAGYGCVEAKKLSKKVDKKTGLTTLVVMVKGNHECGLERPTWDEPLLSRWLVERFDRSVNFHYGMFKSINEESAYVEENGMYVDTCKFTFVYNPN